MGILWFAAWILWAFIVGKLGENRKFRFWGYFFASILLSPLMGLLLVLASDEKVEKKIKKGSSGAA